MMSAFGTKPTCRSRWRMSALWRIANMAPPSWPGLSRPSTSYFFAKAWMPGTRPGMTNKKDHAPVNRSARNIERRDRRHVDEVGILRRQRHDLHRLVEPDY